MTEVPEPRDPAAVAWAKLIVRHRRGLKLSQADLAARVGTVQQVVSAWERGKYAPSPTHQAKLVRVLGIPPHDLHDTILAGAVPA